MTPTSEGQLEGQRAIVEARALADTVSDMVRIASAFVERHAAAMVSPMRAAGGARR